MKRSRRCVILFERPPDVHVRWKPCLAWNRPYWINNWIGCLLLCSVNTARVCCVSWRKDAYLFCIICFRSDQVPWLMGASSIPLGTEANLLNSRSESRKWSAVGMKEWPRYGDWKSTRTSFRTVRSVWSAKILTRFLLFKDKMKGYSYC